jgi:hypothetical protein
MLSVSVFCFCCGTGKQSTDFRLDSKATACREYLERRRGGVSLGWDPSARPEHDGARSGQKIFHQKNICDREYLVEFEQSEKLYLVTRDRVQVSQQKIKYQIPALGKL